MNEITVESLPEEVLVEVFKWLDTKSLKNVMLTCKEWADYVRRFHHWTLNLTATHSFEGIEAMQNRKYNKVLIDGWAGTRGLEFLEMHGASIHELTISCYHSSNVSIWCKLLSTMPNLKKIMLKMSYGVSFSDGNDDELPRLYKLKTLELACEPTAVLKLFKKCQLHTLITSGNYSDLSHQSREEFWNFLATQQDLKELKLNAGGSSALFETPVTEKSIQFRLMELSVKAPVYDNEVTTNSVNNLMEFMKLHTNTLEDVELNLKFPNNFYEFVFSEFKHMKTLNLKVKFDITQPLLEVNESVTSLQLCYDDLATGIAATPFITHLPNVQKLVVNGPCNNQLTQLIAINMKQLKSLDMDNVGAHTFNGVRFPALEFLKIYRVNGRADWDAVAKNNPSVKELWIGNLGRPIHLDVVEITRNLKLRKLTIRSSELKCNENFFDVIRKNCLELKSLELNEKSLMVDISTVADIRGLIFRKF